MPEEAPWADHVVVPDDLRELQADVDAYHREQRIARRRLRWAHVAGNRFVQRLALPAAILVGSIGLAAVVFVVLTFGHPGPAAAPTHEPLATPAQQPGTLHGLLPDVSVSTTDNPRSTSTMSIREVRPAILALVPIGCNCVQLLDAIAGQAFETRTNFVAVAPEASDAEVAALPGQLRSGRVDPVFDANGELAASYGVGAHSVTAIVVAPDGTVQAIVRDLQPDTPPPYLLAPQASPTSR